MPRKKKQPTIDEARTLREQLQGYLYEIISDFEQSTGMTVTDIEVSHKRKPGFGEQEKLTVKAYTEL